MVEIFRGEKTAFGGRAALIPLISGIITSKKKKSNNMKSQVTANKNVKL